MLPPFKREHAMSFNPSACLPTESLVFKPERSRIEKMIAEKLGPDSKLNE
jgi:hypothetical protein